jgi:hypothetical protein
MIGVRILVALALSGRDRAWLVRRSGLGVNTVVIAFWTASYREREGDLGARAALSCFQQLTG